MSESSHQGRALHRALSAAASFARTLRIAASVSEENLRWLDVNKRRHVVLLDFDVVYGALARAQWRPRGLGEELEGIPLVPFSLAGESVTRLLLKITPEFVLPPGATAELLSYRHASRRELSRRAQLFLRRVEATKSQALAAATPESMERLRKVLLVDATKFSADLRREALLDAVVDRATPIESFVSRAEPPSEGPLLALQESYEYLSRKRPKHERNNFNDALNAAAVASLLTNSGKSARVPILVTQTTNIVDLNKRLSLPNLPDVSAAGDAALPFSAFSDALFLVVFESLLAQTEQRYAPAADKAGQLVFECGQFARSVERLVLFCRARAEAGEPVSHVGQLPLAKWNMMLYHHNQLMQNWRDIFAPLQLASKQDLAIAASGLRGLAREAVDEGRDKSTQRLVVELIDKLETSKPPVDHLWKAVVEISQNTRFEYSPGDLDAPVTAAFSLTWRDSSAEMLRDTKPAMAMDSLLENRMAGAHCVEVNAVPSILAAGAAVRVISLRDPSVSPRRYLRIVWLHTLGLSDAILRCESALRCAIGDAARPIDFLFAHTSDGVVDVPWPDVASWLNDENSTSRTETIELRTGVNIAFADIQPVEGAELQMSLTLREDQFAASAAGLASVLEASSEVPLAQTVAQSILTEFARVLYVPLEKRP